MISGKNQIGKQLVNGGKDTFKTYNPKSGEENEWVFFEASSDEVDQACELANSTFVEFRNISDKHRAQFLREIANQIEDLGDALVQTYCLESGLEESRALVERTRTCYQITSLADMLDSGEWKETTFHKGTNDLRKTYIPLGPVVVFGSSNFPLAYSTAGGDTASALAVGCPVIVKSHPMHAGTGDLVSSAIIRAAEKTGMPNGVFSNLNAQSYKVGKALVENRRVKAVGFTGSIAGGRAIMDLAAARPEPIPVFAEMGSINPVVITTLALQRNAEKWAELYASSITQGTGQFCTNPGLILGIESPELDQFANLLSEKITEIKPTVMLGSSIKSAYTNLKEGILMQEGVKQVSAKIEVASNIADQTIVMVSGQEFLKNSRLHQEVFGPFSMIVRCASEEERYQIIDSLEGQLTATIISEEEELKKTKKLVELLSYRVGRIIFNGVPTGVEVCPAMQHGGPYPASSDSRFTAVGLHGIRRWIRPISFQNFPNTLLPDELKQ